MKAIFIELKKLVTLIFLYFAACFITKPLGVKGKHNIMTVRKICKGYLLIAVALFVLVSGSLKAQNKGFLRAGERTIIVDLMDIQSLTVRSEMVQYLEANDNIRISSFENMQRLAISSRTLSTLEMRAYYDDGLRRYEALLLEQNKDDKTLALQAFASKYGFVTTDLLMGAMMSDTENDSCRNSLPFCTDLIYNFPAGVNSGNGESGPNYGCLGSEPNPAWYHMKIAIAGSLTIKMFSQPAEDIDFILWGPFDDPNSPCVAGLTANRIVDCSYSPAPIEYCDISNAVLGKYYILLITNFSNAPCNITFQKTGGTGATDCTIVPPPIDSNSPLCYGEDIMLTADNFPGATYAWTGPNGWSSNLQNPVIFNAQIEDSGLYSLVITVNGSSSDPISTNVIVNAVPLPDFSATEVCFGATTEFTNLSSTNPDGYSISSQLWNFGDFQTSALENPTHSYANPGEYTVTLTCYTGMFNCAQTASKVVRVFEFPVVDAGIDQAIPNGWTTQLTGSVTGGSGNVSYQWTPAEFLIDATILNPVTLSLTSTVVFTLTATDETSGCVSTDDVIVSVTGGALYVQATATPNVICAGENADLFAYTTGGGGDYTYTWTSNPVGFTSNIPDPVVSPNVTSTYYVSVNDGQVTVNSQATVTVKPFPVVSAGEDKTINVGTSTFLSGYCTGGSGSYTLEWNPVDSLANPADYNIPNPETKLLGAHTTFTLLSHDNNGCVSLPDEVTVYTVGDHLGVIASVDDNEICLNDATRLLALPYGGSTEYTITWTADNSSWTYEGLETIISPLTTTEYTVSVNDGFKVVSDKITVIVNDLPVVDLKPTNINWYSTDTINVCVRDSIWLDAGANMNYLWNNGSDQRQLRVVTNGQWIDFQTYSVEVTNPVTGCQSSDVITIFFDFNTCNLAVDEKNDVSNLLNISPNPNVGQFYLDVHSLPESGTFNLTDSHGKTILHRTFEKHENNNKPFLFDLTNQPGGLYILMYQSDHNRAVKQVIKH